MDSTTDEGTVWILGNDPDCDVVVDRPSVSWRHCRLRLVPGGTYDLEDLGSTNGTYVNGVRIAGPTVVSRHDSVTLGQTVPMPWPADPPPAPGPQVRVVRVGRDPDNDVVVDRPEVSLHHARVLIAPGAREGLVEDLGSTNGTALGSAGNQVTRATISPADVLYLGPVAVPAARFFGVLRFEGPDLPPWVTFRGDAMTLGRDPGCDFAVDSPVVSGRHARLVRSGGATRIEDLGSSNGTFVNGRRVERTAVVGPGDLIGLGSYSLRLDVDSVPGEPPPDSSPVAARSTRGTPLIPWLVAVGLAAHAVLLAGGIIVASGVSRPSALFGLALASVWIGLCSVLVERPPGPWAWTFVRPVFLDLMLCGIVLGLVSARIPVGGRWAASWGVLCLSALVGSALERTLVRLPGRWTHALAAAVVLTTLMAGSGMPSRSRSPFAPAARAIAPVFPARWTFEALLLLSARGNDDPAGPYFPATEDRMGLTACVTALLAMLGGLVYAEVVIAVWKAEAST